MISKVLGRGGKGAAALVATLGAWLVLGSTPVWAVCAAPRVESITAEAPNLLMVVDQSLSMETNAIGPDTLWALAEQILKGVASWSYQPGPCVTGSSPRSCDRVRIGLHFWSHTSRTEISPGEGTSAGLIGSKWGSAGGYTQFHLATRLIRSEPALDAAGRVNAAVFVTDGAPDHAFTLRRAVRDICALRLGEDPAPVATYAVGFGGATITELNALLGAAGGTQGNCTLGGEPKDPCDYYQYEQAYGAGLWSTFSGLLSGTEPTRFNQVYTQLGTNYWFTEDAVDTAARLDLALDWALLHDWDATGTAAQQAWVNDMKNTLAWVVEQEYHEWCGDNLFSVRVPCSSSAPRLPASGWSPSQWEVLETPSKEFGMGLVSLNLANGFACSGGITATSAHALQTALQEILGSLQCIFPLNLLEGMTGAPTQTQYTHVSLELPAYGRLTIPHVSDAIGRESLDDLNDLSGLSAAYQAARGGSPEAQFGDDDDGWDWANSGRTAIKLRGDVCGLLQHDFVSSVETKVCEPCSNVGVVCAVPEEEGRCAQGKVVCDDFTGTEYCTPVMSQMPEICNGLDDDCDGRVDNLSDSWQNSFFTSYLLPDDHAGVECNQQDTCTCPDGASDTHAGASFAEYLDAWSGACGCGEGLSGGPAVSAAPPDAASTAGQDGRQAACSVATAGGAGTGGALGCALFALVGLVRRRREGC